MARKYILIILAMLTGAVLAQSIEEVDALQQQAEALYEQGEYRKALTAGQKALDASRSVHGTKSKSTYLCAWHLGRIHKELKDYQEAEKHFRLALDILEKVKGPEDPEVADLLSYLGPVYETTGDLEQALSLYKRELAIREQAPGGEDLDTGGTLYRVALLSRKTGDYEGAIQHFTRALAVFEKEKGPAHEDALNIRLALALTYRGKGDHQQALSLFQDVVATREKMLGPEHLDTAQSLAHLAQQLSEMKRPQEAVPIFKRVIAIRERVLGPEHPVTVGALYWLAIAYQDLKRYEQALPLYKRALAIREKALGPEHPDTASSLNNLAHFYGSMGDYQQALPLYKRALAIRKKALGPLHPATAMSLSNLARLYESMGDYQQSLPLYKRALTIREEALGPRHPDTATSLNNLAGLYINVRDLQLALPLFKRALSITEEAVGSKHPSTATSLNNLALLYSSMGNYEQALPLYKRALSITEEALGPEHPSTASSLNNLAGLYQSVGDYQRALPLNHRALSIAEKNLGSQHPGTATSLVNLAYLFTYTGDHQQALPLYNRALAIFEKTKGQQHPFTTTTINSLAELQIDLNCSSDALALAERATSGNLATTANIFTFASERQRLAYQERQQPYNLFGTLNSAPNLIQQALRYKGLVLDSMVEDLRLAESSEDPATRELATQVKSVKSQLNQLVFNAPTDLDEEAREKRAKREAELKTQLEDLQGQLARQGVEQGNLRRAFTITPEQVQSALPPDSVLVEFLRYDHYLGKREYQARYGAVILPKQGEPVWAPLPGKAEDLETLISTYKKLVRSLDFTRAVPLAPDTYDQGTETAVLKDLYQQVWLPVEKALPEGTKTVVISPDGELNFLSFATLLTPDDRFLAEEYTLTYVSSGRDLVANTSKKPQSQTLLVGDPAFGEAVQQKESNSALSRAVDTRDWQQMSFAPLPYTRAECQGLEKLFQQRQQKVTALFSESATEAQLRQVQAPETLHMATHGYFLPEPEVNKKARERARRMDGQEFDLPLKDPMYRSGLALAGAQTTVQLRANGKSPDFRNDGLLTAAEVGILNLSGTRLVTLSACDTGSGESRAGEGVLGLRRGFVQAGARNLIMTLWPVADKETSELMQEFYVRADSRPAPLAMAEVQKEWLTRLRAEKSLSEAVRLAGPFVLSFQGRIE